MYVQKDQTNGILLWPKQKAAEDGQTEDTIPEQVLIENTFVISGDVNEKQSIDAGK